MASWFSPTVAIIGLNVTIILVEILIGVPVDRAIMPAIVCVALGTLAAWIAMKLAKRQITGIAIVTATVLVAIVEIFGLRAIQESQAPPVAQNPFDRFDKPAASQQPQPVDLRAPDAKDRNDH